MNDHYVLINNTTGEIIIDAAKTDSISASSVSSYDEIRAPAVYDDYYEAANNYIIDFFGGDPVERGWVFEGDEYLRLENEDDAYYYWSWNAGGGFGSFKQYKADIYVFEQIS